MDNQRFGKVIIRTIQDYLTERTFIIRIDGIRSMERRIMVGLSQGLPVLYYIYTRDIPREEEHRNPYIYATSKFFQQGIDKLEKWTK